MPQQTHVFTEFYIPLITELDKAEMPAQLERQKSHPCSPACHHCSRIPTCSSWLNVVPTSKDVGTTFNQHPLCIELCLDDYRTHWDLAHCGRAERVDADSQSTLSTQTCRFFKHGEYQWGTAAIRNINFNHLLTRPKISNIILKWIKQFSLGKKSL